MIKIISSLRLSLGEYGHQRTSSKFHDLVLNLKFQNYRSLETLGFKRFSHSGKSQKIF